MLRQYHKFVFLIIILIGFSFHSYGTHMVGGDFSYKSLGKGYFEIKLTIRRDCEFGASDAFFDQKAVIAVFDQNGSLVKEVGNRGAILLDYIGNDTLNESLNKRCGVLGYPVCVHEAIYTGRVYLPRPEANEKLILVYQRCCRNQTLLNIEKPLETGGTYMIEINQYAYDQKNSSPAFKKWPDIYICSNTPINFDHSAIEADGDSLVYKLYTPFTGATIQYPLPTTENVNQYTPLYNTVSWAGGYSLNNVLGGTNPLKIDPKTGLLTGTPVTVGQFLVGVLVEEYRGGKLISTIRRDFEYNVRDCVEPPDPKFELNSTICGTSHTDTLKIENLSQYANTYKWTIYIHSTDQTIIQTTKDLNYIYTLPSSKKDTFDISLEAYSIIANCSKSITKTLILIEDYLKTDFDYKITQCSEDDIVIELTDKFDELNPYYVFKENKWIINSGTLTLTGTGKHIFMTVPKNDNFTITLEETTAEGCTSTLTKNSNYKVPKVSFIANPTVLCEGTSTKLVSNPNSSWTYIWAPETGLTFNGNDKSNPTVTINHDQTYNVTVTDGICSVSSSVFVDTKPYFDISISGPNYVCKDSVKLTVVGIPSDVPGAIVEWSFSPDFNPIVKSGREVILYLSAEENHIYARIKSGTGCSTNVATIKVTDASINLEYDKNINYCYKNYSVIELIDNSNIDGNTYSWQPNPIIVSGLNSNKITIYSDSPGEFDLVFIVSNEFGCSLQDTIHVNSLNRGEATIKNTSKCGTYEMCYELTGISGITSYTWQLTKADGTITSFNTQKPCLNYGKAGTYHVSVEYKINGCDNILKTEKDVIVNEILDITISSQNVIYCKGDQVTLTAVQNTDAVIKWVSIPSGTVLYTGNPFTYSPHGNEQLYVIGTDSNNCTDSLKIYLSDYKFDLTFKDLGVLCKYDTVTFELINNTSNQLTYEWFGNNIISGKDSNKPVVAINGIEEYSVKVTDKLLGCDTILNYTVDVSHIDVNIDAAVNEVVINNSIQIEVVNVPSGSQINWSSGETNVTKITISPTSTTNNAIMETKEYCVTVTDQYGCQDVDCITITIINPACDESDIFIPNAFSPNGDNYNDVFRPRGLYIRSIEMEIYDRWGELLFQKNGDENLSWDGTYKNKDLPPDTYTYKIKVICQDNDNWSKVSNVSLLK